MQRENKADSSPIQDNNGDLSQQEIGSLIPESTATGLPKRKRTFLWGVALFVFLIGYGINWVRFSLFPSIASCGKMSEELAGKYTVSTINRAQQDYFLENQSFAQDSKSLPYGFQPDNKHFSYAMQATNQAVFSHAIVRPNAYKVRTEYFGPFWWDVQELPAFKSSVGAVFAVQTNKIDPKTKQKQMTTVSIICNSLQPGARTLAAPKLVKGVPTCSAGTKE